MDRLHGDPHAIAAADQQPVDVYVGEEDGEGARDRARGEAQRQARLWAPRVVVGAQRHAAVCPADPGRRPPKARVAPPLLDEQASQPDPGAG
jgi:hypothetical protein